MTVPACPACGGGPVTRNGSRTVMDPLLSDGTLTFPETVIRRRQCKACGRTCDEVDPARAARIREAVRFMAACLAAEGVERGAARCGVAAKTLARHVEAEIDRVLVGPIPETVFVSALPEKDATLVIGDGGPGRFLDAVIAETAHLNDMLDRRGGNVTFAWVPLSRSVCSLVRDAMPDATQALCTVQAAQALDRVVDAMLAKRTGMLAAEGAMLRDATRAGWTMATYLHLRDVLSRAKEGMALPTLNLWDEELRNAFQATAASPGVGMPSRIAALTPLRVRSLAIVTPDPTLRTMTRTLELNRHLRRTP